MRLLVLLATLAFAGVQDGPKFSTGTHLVQINVIVHDKNAQKLSKEDFVVTDNGKQQRISVFSVSAEPATAAELKLPPDTFSNRTAAAANPNSVTIVLLDRLNTLATGNTAAWEDRPTWLDDHALAYAKEHLIEFVKQMDARDRVAIYSLAESLTVLSDFSNDREQLLRILSGYKATSVTDREKVDPRPVHTPVPCCFDAAVNRDRQTLANLTNTNRAQITMAALMSIASHVAAIPGRKNLVWLTADLPFPPAAIARIVERANIAIYPVDARGLLTKRVVAPIDDSTGIFGGAKPGAPDSQPRGQDVMQEIADDTGGRAFINTNDLAQAIRSAVEDAAVTYTLGFYPESSSLDGKFHALKVHLKQGHVALHGDLRYPKGYFAWKGAPVAAESGLELAAQSPLESAAIPLLARVDRVDQPKANSIRISASIDLHHIELAESEGRRKGRAEVVVIEQDARGSVLARERKSLNLDLSRENYEAMLKSGIFVGEVIEPREGLATIRLMVADAANGATGSLIIPVSQIK